MAGLNRLVVVGDDDLAERCRALLPQVEVIGPAESPDLADPVGAVGVIRTMLGAGRTPLTVVCPAIPGFTALTQVPGLPAQRCLVLAEGDVWPLSSVRVFVEALQMTYLPALEALPAALRSGPSPRGRGAARSSDSATAVRSAEPAPPPPPFAPADGAARLDPEPVHLPPTPLAPAEWATTGSPWDPIDAAPRTARPAYQPTDVLRPLRPSRG
ncbi:MAG TPA: hypothetical protein VMW49_06235 [Candidatus Dormibacteraeota bacterium]|nr:hypothetical protein [Candidatus Dormibacteraeota bacterium]